MDSDAFHARIYALRHGLHRTLSKLVCGLHVEHNLRVITQKENQRKNNVFWPDMP